MTKPSNLRQAGQSLYDACSHALWALEKSEIPYIRFDIREQLLRAVALAHGNADMQVAAWNYPEGDDEYQERIITEVERGKDGKIDCISSEMGTIGWRNESAVVPKLGDLVRYYGRGFGSPVRGLFVNGERIWYETEAEYRARAVREGEERDQKRREDFEREGRPKLDAAYEKLPKVFRKRIDRFRQNNPDFRWEYEEYEMFCCEQAVLIADALESADAVQAFHDLPWEQQQARVPGLSDGHSGNTFGCACRLAYLYLMEPEAVMGEMGALTVIAGSKYGDFKQE